MKRILVVLALTLLVSPFHGALKAVEQPEWIPAPLRVPAGHAVLLQALAVGVQIYDCEATSAGYVWNFRAPEAGLFNGSVQLIGTHFAGPTWQAPDGSRVIGMRLESADAPNPRSIPWLLLRAASHAGDGAFSQVTYIQRVLTGGGVAPSPQSCDATHVGEEARIDYSAVYYFYVAAK